MRNYGSVYKAVNNILVFKLSINNTNGCIINGSNNGSNFISDHADLLREAVLQKQIFKVCLNKTGNCLHI